MRELDSDMVDDASFNVYVTDFTIKFIIKLSEPEKMKLGRSSKIHLVPKSLDYCS